LYDEGRRRKGGEVVEVLQIRRAVGVGSHKVAVSLIGKLVIACWG